MESRAVAILKKELETGSVALTTLSVRVKWGQGDLAQLGNFRSFLKKYPEAFRLEGNTVHLAPAGAAANGDQASNGAAIGVSKAAGVAPGRLGVLSKSAAVAAVAAANSAEEAESVALQKGALAKAPPQKARPWGAGSATVPKSAVFPKPAGHPPREGPDEEAGAPDNAGACPLVPKGGLPKAFGSLLQQKVDLQKMGLALRKAAAEKVPVTADAAHPVSKSAGIVGLEPKAIAAKPRPPGMITPQADGRSSRLPQPRWQQDDLTNDELAKMISGCKAYGIEMEIQALAQRIAPSPEYTAACRRTVALLRSAVVNSPARQSLMPQVLDFGGSFAQDTHLDGSDVDVILHLSPGLSPEARESCARSLRERLQAPPQSEFLTVFDTMHLYPHATSPLSLELRGASPRTVAHVIAVESQAGQTDVRPQLTLDAMIKQLCDTFVMARDLIRLVKLWAVNHGLLQQVQYMNGVAWTLLVIFFLQLEGLVPPCAELRDPDSRKRPAQEDRRPLATLLRAFFSFVAAKEGPQRGFSVTFAREYRAQSDVLFIEDPAEFQRTRQQINLTAYLRETQWARVVEEARRAQERLTARPQRWFHWAEVFDPRELPPERLARLPPMAASVASSSS